MRKRNRENSICPYKIKYHKLSRNCNSSVNMIQILVLISHTINKSRNLNHPKIPKRMQNNHNKKTTFKTHKKDLKALMYKNNLKL